MQKQFLIFLPEEEIEGSFFDHTLMNGTANSTQSRPATFTVEPDLVGHSVANLIRTGASDFGVLDGEETEASPRCWSVLSVEELAPQFPGFELVRLLGRGGMGAVYQAKQTSLDRFVAIKVLPLELSDDPEFEARFRREAKSLAELTHPNIVQIFEFKHTPAGHPYFVMEYVNGADLQELLRSDRFAPQMALDVASQVCRALEFAHEKGYVHRDIKPANVFLTADGQVKVGDFGLAKLINSEAPKGVEALTLTGVAMGTPHYVAPEQTHPGATTDHRADLYSLGVMFYEMLTGEIPRGTIKAVSKKVDVPPQFDRILFRAMEPNPGRSLSNRGLFPSGSESCRKRIEITEGAHFSMVSWHLFVGCCLNRDLGSLLSRARTSNRVRTVGETVFSPNGSD